MRVDFTNLGTEPAEKSKTGRAGSMGTASASSASASAATESGAGVDQTSLSFDRARVQTLEAKALAAPEVRMEKVAPLQQAVASGNYPVDAVKVAEAMAAEAASGRVR